MDQTSITKAVSRSGGRVSDEASEIASDEGVVIVSTNDTGGISVNGAWSGSFDSVDDLYVMSDGSVSQNPDHDHVMVITPEEGSGSGAEISFSAIGLWKVQKFQFVSRSGVPHSGLMIVLPDDARAAAA